MSAIDRDPARRRRGRPGTSALCLGVGLTLALGLPGTVVAGGQPAATIVDDYAAGSMDVRLTGGIKHHERLGLHFGSRHDASVEFTFWAPQGAQGSWGYVQLILPVLPGTIPLDPETSDAGPGIGYVDWALQGVPDPGPGCVAAWSEQDGVASGSVTCPRKRTGTGKRMFQFASTFRADPTDAWRTCLPGYLPEARPSDPAATTVPVPAPGTPPPVAPSPSPGRADPAAAMPPASMVWATLVRSPACVPGTVIGTAASPRPAIDACALLTPGEVATALELTEVSVQADPVMKGVCGYRTPDGYGVTVVATRGVNPLPPRGLGGLACSSVELDHVGDRGWIAGCPPLPQTWAVAVDAAVRGDEAVTIVVAAPSYGLGLLSTRAEQLLESAVSRLP